MWPSAAKLLNKAADVPRFLRQARYLRRLRPAATAPYPCGLYRELLATVTRLPRLRPMPFTERGSPESREVNLYFRHDVDTADCVRNLGVLLEADKAAGVAAGIYFRADGEPYRLGDHRDILAACRREGFEVGLHTVCYLHDDYLAEFRRETDVFSAAAGFRPTSFTVHGLGLVRAEVRARFGAEIVGRLGEFGYEFTDCGPPQRIYHYVVHDCHRDPATGGRYLCNDFREIPSWLRPGGNLLVLTHPVYWK